MFSSITQKLNVELSDKEILVTLVLKKWLESENKDKQLFARQTIEKWPTAFVMRYAKDPFIYQFLDTNTEIQEKWKVVAIEKGFPDCPLKGKISHEIVSLFQSFQAQYYLQLFGGALNSDAKNNDDRIVLLEKACRLGSFRALIIRCNINIKVLTRPATSALRAAQQPRIQQVEADTKRLRNLFGAAGYAASGVLTNNLSRCFLKNSSESENTESKEDLKPDIDRALAYYHESFKHFFCAWLLRNNEGSNHLINILTEGKGLADLFSENDTIQFSNWENALEFIKKSLNDTSYKLILARAEAEIKTYLQEEKEPSITLNK